MQIFFPTFEVFLFVQVSHIAHGTSGKRLGVSKCIQFLLKVIVQGQGHQETFQQES